MQDNKNTQFQFFTPRSTDARLKDYGLSATMMPPPMIIPTKEDLRAMNELLNKQVVQISSTQAPISFSTAFPEQQLTEEVAALITTPAPHFSPTPAVPLTSQDALQVTEEEETTEFTFMPTPMPKSTKAPFTNRQSVFQFQPTPMAKKLRFKPTKAKKDDRKSKKLAALFTKPEINAINQQLSSFAPEFVLDPDMKDNFAIVKVKNHKLTQEKKLVEDSKEKVKTDISKPEAVVTTESVLTTSVPTTPSPRVTTTTAPREKLKELLSRNPVRTRGRLVKKVKSRGQIKDGVLKNMKDQKTRRRLQFIKRGKSVPKSRARAKVRANEIEGEKKKKKKMDKEPRISVSVSSSVSQSSPVRRVKPTERIATKPAPEIESTKVSDLALKEEEANRRVAELTNNILELKAKLEALRLELEEV